MPVEQDHSGPRSPDGAKVLIVDDTAANVVVLRETLAPLGLDLLEASSGREALRHLLNHDDVALIVMDVQMPEMDGVETARLIRARPRHTHTPIIFVTAHHSSDHEVLRAYALGAVDYLFKPFRPEILRYKVSVFRDLHETRRLEREHAALEARNHALRSSNRELETFASAVAHDLREPLRTILGFAGVLRSELDARGDEPMREVVGHIEQASTRMSVLLDDLLTYARVAMQAMPATPTRADLALDAAIANLTASIEGSGATIEREPLPVVRVNPTQLTQLFQNLLANAIKFRGEDPPQVRVYCEPGEEGPVICVADSGIGLDPAHAARVFDIFQRLHRQDEYAGSGVGLATCQRIAERSGGRIWVESELGAGATFKVLLPDASRDGA